METDAQNSARLRRGNPDKIKPFRWKTGVSGNPGGRPKRKLISEALRDGLAECIERGDKTGAMLIADAILAKASKGDVAAAIFVRDTTEGRPMQAVSLRQELSEDTAHALAALAQQLLGPSE
jgi:hypothetical protein